MLGGLQHFYCCKFHESVDFVAGAFKVFDAEGIDGYSMDAGFVADFQNLNPARKR